MTIQQGIDQLEMQKRVNRLTQVAYEETSAQYQFWQGLNKACDMGIAALKSQWGTLERGGNFKS